MKNMSNLDVYIILIDGSRSCDIMYVELSDNLGVKREKFSPYGGLTLKP